VLSTGEIAGKCSTWFINVLYHLVRQLTASDCLVFIAQVEKGDCVVCFNRKDIFAIKREIESSTNLRCCVVYGALPPETRAAQARLFNDPDSGFDVLVASDAIGMGLNLNIRRIIFNSVFKSDGEKIVLLSHSSVKQIAGRAGRRNSPYPHGEVTCRDPRDLPYIRECMARDISPVSKAGLMPTARHIHLYTDAIEKYSPDVNLSHMHDVLFQFNKMATVQGDYFLCRQKQMQMIAKMLKDIPLDQDSKYTISMCPVNTSDIRAMDIIKRFSIKRALGEAAGLKARVAPKRPTSFDELSTMCDMHHELELFLWLSMRFPGNIVEQQAALSLKDRVIDLIEEGLVTSEHLKLEHDYIKRDKRLRNNWIENNGNKSAYPFLDDEIEDDDFYDDEEEYVEKTI